MEKARSTERQPVVFGYDTALQIHRAADPLDVVRSQQRKMSLPNRAPRSAEIAEAVSNAAIACPKLEFAEPVRIVSGGKLNAPRLGSHTVETHLCTRQLPAGSLCSLNGLFRLATPELAFVQMGTLLTLPCLIELGFELCGTYWRTRGRGSPAAESAEAAKPSCRYNLAPLTTVQKLRSFAGRATSLPGARNALRALDYVADGSASPRESCLAIVLGLPPRYGGYGLGGMRMNVEVSATQEARAVTRRGSFRCDLCWPEMRLGIEYQSREYHEGEAHRISDSKRSTALASMRWTVLEITNEELDSLAATDIFAQSVAHALKRRLRPRVENAVEKRISLRRELGLPA